MPDACRMEVRLKAPWSGASAWARLLEDGSIQLELYDFSEEAQNWLGNDVAWRYTVAPASVPELRRLLPAPDDVAVLEAFAGNFPHVHAVRDWLRSNGIPFDEAFDSRA
jgi:hypothetical protein